MVRNINKNTNKAIHGKDKNKQLSKIEIKAFNNIKTVIKNNINELSIESREDLATLIIPSTSDFNNKKLDKKKILLENETKKDINNNDDLLLKITNLNQQIDYLKNQNETLSNAVCILEKKIEFNNGYNTDDDVVDHDDDNDDGHVNIKEYNSNKRKRI